MRGNKVRTCRCEWSPGLRRAKKQIWSRSSPPPMRSLRTPGTDSSWRLMLQEPSTASCWRWSYRWFPLCQSASWGSPRLVLPHSCGQFYWANSGSRVGQHLKKKKCVGRLCVFLEDDILLEVEALYYLRLDFPVDVSEDTASAIFNKKKRTLTLTVDASDCTSAPLINWNQPRLSSHSLRYLLRPSIQHCNVRCSGWTRGRAVSMEKYLITTPHTSLCMHLQLWLTPKLTFQPAPPAPSAQALSPLSNLHVWFVHSLLCPFFSPAGH